LECNRKYIGFEIIPEYVNFANDRIQKMGLEETNVLW
jgi:DNA modification methylase